MSNKTKSIVILQKLLQWPEPEIINIIKIYQKNQYLMNYLHKCLAYPGQNNFFFFQPVQIIVR